MAIRTHGRCTLNKACSKWNKRNCWLDRESSTAEKCGYLPCIPGVWILWSYSRPLLSQCAIRKDDGNGCQKPKWGTARTWVAQVLGTQHASLSAHLHDSYSSCISRGLPWACPLADDHTGRKKSANTQISPDGFESPQCISFPLSTIVIM